MEGVVGVGTIYFMYVSCMFQIFGFSFLSEPGFPGFQDFQD